MNRNCVHFCCEIGYLLQTFILSLKFETMNGVFSLNDSTHLHKHIYYPDLRKSRSKYICLLFQHLTIAFLLVSSILVLSKWTDSSQTYIEMRAGYQNTVNIVCSMRINSIYNHVGLLLFLIYNSTGCLHSTSEIPTPSTLQRLESPIW